MRLTYPQAELRRQLALSSADAAAAIALLESWYDEDADEQRQEWERLKVALDEDRLSARKLFP